MGLFLGATELSTGGGGGGFTKINKYSTFRALGGDTVIKKDPDNVPFIPNGNLNGTSGSVYYLDSSLSGTKMQLANAWVGYTFVNNGTTHTLTASTAHSNYGVPFTITFTPALTSTLPNGIAFTVFAQPLTVNPATDLGLADGASIGYLMVGGGRSVGNDNNIGGQGGTIIQGTAIITTASTNLVLSPGIGSANASSGTQSTISGGLTLTSGNGTSNPGAGASSSASAQPGILGYGQGGKTLQSGQGSGASGGHGYGNGAPRNTSGGDGAILLYY